MNPAVKPVYIAIKYIFKIFVDNKSIFRWRETNKEREKERYI